MCDILLLPTEKQKNKRKSNTKCVEKENKLIPQSYLEVMENLYTEYEASCVLLEKKIDSLLKEQSLYSSKSENYFQLYNRIRRLKKCLDDTRAWQNMVKNYLLAGGAECEKDKLFVDR